MAADLIEAVTFCASSKTRASWLPAARQRRGRRVGRSSCREGTQLPFLVEWKVDEESTYESRGDTGTAPYDDQGEVQISIFATSKSTANAIARTVRKSLNDAPLRFDDGELLMFSSVGKHTLKDPERGPQGTDVWQAVCRFKSLVERHI